MTEQPGVPSAADLDAVNAELEQASKTAGAKEAHDTVTEQPGFPSAADVDWLIGQFTAKNATLDALMAHFREGCPLAPSKETHDLEARLYCQLLLAAMSDFAAKKEAPAVSEGTKAAPAVYSREGVLFDPEVHAAHEDGTPKTDSRGVFISKEHDYNPRTPNMPGGK